MNPFASLADVPRQLRHPKVRDLAWTIVSPPMLDEPAPNQRHPLRATAWAARPHMLLDWLLSLDAHPAVLCAWLAQRPVRRLGLYYERLWQFALMHAPGVELLAANLPVRLAGRTLGEFDLLLRDDEGLHHLELAVKFYLARTAAGSAETRHWLGPGSHDRLDLKLAQMRGPQLGLSSTAPARALLAEHGMGLPAPALWLGGYLFQPWPQGCPAPSMAATDHLGGHWLRQHDWPALRSSTADACWRQLPRLAWLAPACLDDPQLEDYDEERSLDSTPLRPVLLARLERAADGRWQEVERVFVVPDAWPQPAPGEGVDGD